MSDGGSDGLKMQRQHEAFEGYLDKLIAWLHDPTHFINYEAALEAASALSSYYGNQLHGTKRLTSNAREFLEALRANRKQVWAEFLFSITQPEGSGKSRRIELKSLSPFAEQLQLSVTRWGHGKATIVVGADFEKWLLAQLPKMTSETIGTTQHALFLDLPAARNPAVYEVK